jgi:hypothetical protein
MMQIVLFFLATFGLIYLVVESVIFAPFRLRIALQSIFLESFIYCAYCTGFWIGVALSAVLQTWAAGFWPILIGLVDAALCGAAVMGAIAFIRGFAPHFLTGAWDREREILDDIRRRQAEPGELDPRQSTGADGGGGDGST